MEKTGKNFFSGFSTVFVLYITAENKASIHNHFI